MATAGAVGPNKLAPEVWFMPVVVPLGTVVGPPKENEGVVVVEVAPPKVSSALVVWALVLVLTLPKLKLVEGADIGLLGAIAEPPKMFEAVVVEVGWLASNMSSHIPFDAGGSLLVDAGLVVVG